MAEKYLVVGASRGVGLGLVAALVSQGRSVVATSRDGGSHAPAAHWLALDITDSGSCRRVCGAAVLDGTTHIVIAAGLMPKDVDKTLDPAVVAAVFATNSVAPVALVELLAQRLGPTLRHVMFLGSRMGSVYLNITGDDWVYRASKAALTSAAKSLHVRHAPGLAVTVAHPGWVRTEMGGPRAEIDVATSVSGLLVLLDAMSRRTDFRYCDYLGRNLPY
jgi:NAD(P)-dependent dehydrogenase (short-subunit alcohol dehydrogenase family)